jgi:alkylhydroperoxidase family enzyme
MHIALLIVVPDDFRGEFNVDSDSSRRDAEEVEKEGLGLLHEQFTGYRPLERPSNAADGKNMFLINRALPPLSTCTIRLTLNLSSSVTRIPPQLKSSTKHLTTTSYLNMRLPYIPDDPRMATEEDAAIVQRVKDRRGGKLIALDKTLLHAPAVANGWNAFLGAIRTQTSLSDSIREIAICRVAVLNHAWYEWDSHRPILENSGVLSAEAIEHLKQRPGEGKQEERAKMFDDKHLAVLEYTDAMTLGCIVPDPLFQKLKGFFSEKEVVEITSTVAAYNCVSRFLVALDVGEMAEKYDVDMSGKKA